MANVVPDTENTNVALIAVAWEIVRLTVIPNLKSGSDYQAETTNAVIKTYVALLSQEPIEK